MFVCYKEFMRLIALENQLPKFFTVSDLQDALKIKRNSARIFCNRYLKKGYFLRIKRDLYTIARKIYTLNNFDYLGLSNLLQDGSYISLQTALSYHRIIANRMYFIEAISPTRSTDIYFGHYHFKYCRLPKKYHFGRGTGVNGIKIATPEKALLDIIYLTSLGKYFIQFRSINLEHLSYPRLLNYSKKYPLRTQKLLLRLFNRSFKMGKRH